MAALVSLQQGDMRNLELLNSAYITLIPKKADAREAKDYRPISLVHSFAKLVTKILANRLAPQLNTLVATNQSAFIRGRCIHDNYMLVQQTIKVLHQRKILSLFLKLDISKAFDSVDWAFLLEILTHLGFGPTWVSIISNLLRSASTQIILNGIPGESIFHQRGLRQGDPLSPMLFILVMDVLNSLFIKAESEGLLLPLLSTGQRLSLYADDVALFIRSNEQDLQLTKNILAVFGEASGLQTNLQKSCVIPIQCDEEFHGVVNNTLHCATANFPTTYLGLPISNKKLRKCDLMVWIEKIANKLPGWKASLMTLAGRAVLVKSVLTAIPIYILVAIKVPKWFLRAVDKIRRGFLWTGRQRANGGCCLVAWEKVMRPLDLGGLGIHNLEVLGWALQMRWLWMEKTRPDRWRKLDQTAHGQVSKSRSTHKHRPCLLLQLNPWWGMEGIRSFGLIAGCMAAAWRAWPPTLSAVFPSNSEKTELCMRLYKRIGGSQTLKMHLVGLALPSILSCGTYFLKSTYLIRKMYIIGNLRPQDHSQRNRLTEVIFWDLSHLNLGKGFGSLGHQGSARHLYGLPFGTAAGQQTA